MIRRNVVGLTLLLAFGSLSAWADNIPIGICPGTLYSLAMRGNLISLTSLGRTPSLLISRLQPRSTCRA